MPEAPRLLVLFPGRWEQEFLTDLARAGGWRVAVEGFDASSLTHLLRAPWFDVTRFVDSIVSRWRGRVDAVWSNDDMLGCLLAAVVARLLGLPGADPATIVRAQHKLLQRRALSASLPANSVPAALLPCALTAARGRSEPAIAAAVEAAGLTWPLFTKPVKGTFSAMARRVRSAAELAAHVRLPWLDRRLLGALTRDFDRLAAVVMPLPCPGGRMLAEPCIDGEQVNVDGYVHRGDVRILGVVDEWMYPGEHAGARHFAGFTYPSRRPGPALARLGEVAAAAVRALGYDHGLFNVELFVLADGSVRVIEVNPRAAGQFAMLYRDVDGVDLDRLGIWLAAGRAPDELPRLAPCAAAAASFVFRRFDGGAGLVPSDAGRAWLTATHPRARLWSEPVGAFARRREYRWVGSLRYAVLNHSAADAAALAHDGRECARRLFGVELPPLG